MQISLYNNLCRISLIGSVTTYDNIGVSLIRSLLSLGQRRPTCTIAHNFPSTRTLGINGMPHDLFVLHHFPEGDLYTSAYNEHHSSSLPITASNFSCHVDITIPFSFLIKTVENRREEEGVVRRRKGSGARKLDQELVVL